MKTQSARCLAVVAGLLIAACKPAPAPATSAAATAAQRADPITASAFVDRVWRVEASSAVEPGTLYVFLSEGTLVIAAASGTPTLGKWRYAHGALTMVEESHDYPTDILALDDRHFTIRSHNPGTPVEITLERAAP